ncbi:SusC/RagA family TonB-linked outer membrane protein [Sphingobacterium faecale]|nr:SusC/RagA family TonB-linked outer membrane protein [Sphingobacterium faecale]
MKGNQFWKLLLFLGLFFVAHSSFAQQISVNRNKSSLKNVFQDIMDQTDHVFVYNDPKIEEIWISLKISNSSLENVLKQISKAVPLEFKVIQKNITVKYTQAIVEKTPIVIDNAQQQLISGTVTDSLNQPIIGVSVSVLEDNRKATATDVNGRFVIEATIGQRVVVRMVEYKDKNISILNDRPLLIQLENTSDNIEEVVVVAYGTQKRKEMVGAITTIRPEELKVPSSNLTTALAGRLAGVIAYQRSGEPGQDNAEFFIRGVTTFGYKKDPLILIDGVEFTSTDLARLQPDDIASFSIMKDASATALYGARGANGVILVTTKEGKEGPAKISFRLENSLSTPTKDVEMADPIRYMELSNEAIRTRDPLSPVLYSQEKIDMTRRQADPILYPATDWRSTLFKDYTMNQRANLNVSGGGSVARYYFAGTFNKDNGVLKVDPQNNFNNNIDLKSYLLRSNVNVNLSKSTEVGVRMYGSFDEYTGPISGGKEMYEMVMFSNPVVFPAYYPKDENSSHIQHILFGGSDKGNYVNPYAEMVKGYRDYSRSVIMAQFELKQKLHFLTQGLTFRAMGNTNKSSYHSVSRFYNPFYYQVLNYDKLNQTYTLANINEKSATEYLGYNEGDKTIKSTFYLESALNYSRTFKDKHAVNAMLVYIMQESLNANAGNLQLSLPSRNQGLSGRFTYSLNSKYFAEFNFGYNGSERFDKNNRFGFFPSGGIGWQISDEKFWKPLQNYIDVFKVRGTYGMVGNDAIGSASDRFFYLSNVNMNDAARASSFGTDFNYTLNGVSISRYANPDITWEVAYKANLGFEMTLFKDIQIQADVFSEYRKNILMTRAAIPSYLGFSSALRANVGEASSRGLDMSIDYSHNFENGLWLSARGNFTYATSKFEIYEEPDYDANSRLSRVGYNINQTWGYLAERLFIDDEEVYNSPEQGFGVAVRGGDIKYRDVNGDGIISSLDRVPIGNPTSPEIVYGFGISTGYKNIDFSMFLQGLANESFWINPRSTAPFVSYADAYPSRDAVGYAGSNQMLKVYADNHWSEANPDPLALWPRLSPNINENNTQTSTWFMRNGSFLRLKNVELGYSLPKRTISKLNMEKLRLYLNGTNLLNLSQFKLWDVEMAGNGLGYPVQRVFNIGAQVSF